MSIQKTDIIASEPDPNTGYRSFKFGSFEF